VTGGRAYAVTYRCRNTNCSSYDLVSSPVLQSAWKATNRLPSAETTTQNASVAAFGTNVWMVLTPRAGGPGRMLVSRNGGGTFSELPRDDYLGPYSCSLTATSAETIWGTCYYSHASANVRSSDGGKRFFQIAGIPASSEFPSTSLFPLSNEQAVVLFYNPDVPMSLTWELELTTKSGRTFQPSLAHQEVSAVGFATRSTWFVLGRSTKGNTSLAWRTTISGHSWQTVKLPNL